MTDESSAPAQLSAGALTPTETWASQQAGIEISVLANGARVLNISRDFATRANVLGPTSQIVQVNPSFSPTPRVTFLDAAKDTYPQPGGRALHASALRKLADMAGIEHFGTEWDYMGGAGVRASVTGRMRNPDGTWRTCTKAKAVRFEVHNEKTRQDAIKKAGDNPPSEAKLAELVAEDMEHIDAKCETKAWSRVVRELLAIPSSYTQADLQKPFFCLRWLFTPDHRDPLVGRLMELQFNNGVASMYALDGLPAPDAVAEQHEIERTVGLRDPDGELEAGEHDDDEDEDWGDGAPVDAAVVIDRPDQDYVFPGGKFKGQPMSMAVQSDAGQQYLAAAIPTLRSPARRALALAWLSFQRGVLIDEAAAVTIANGEVPA